MSEAFGVSRAPIGDNGGVQMGWLTERLERARRLRRARARARRRVLLPPRLEHPAARHDDRYQRPPWHVRAGRRRTARFRARERAVQRSRLATLGGGDERLRAFLLDRMANPRSPSQFDRGLLADDLEMFAEERLELTAELSRVGGAIAGTARVAEVAQARLVAAERPPSE